MDDNFTVGPKDEDDKRVVGTLARMDKKIDTIAVNLRAMLMECRELNVTLMEMNCSIQRRSPDLSPDKRALIDLRQDYASVWGMYANLQQRMDRIDDRIGKIEDKLEPPLPSFLEFGK